MEHLVDGSLLDAVRGLHWPARRVTRASHHGGNRSRRIGQSPEFVQYREYRQGDEPSKIDWKLYARTHRVAVRETQDESDLRTMIVVDATASMAFPVPQHDKWRVAAAVAVCLAAVTQADQDPVGVAVVSGDDVTVLPPRSRMSVTANVMHALERVRPGGSRPLAPLIESLRSVDRLAIISDFLGDAEAVLDASARWVAAGREVFALHVIAREEIDPPGNSIVVDPEDEAIKRPLDASGLDAYREAFGTWRAGLIDRFRAAGAEYRTAVTDEEIPRIVRGVVAPAATVALP